MTISIWWAAGAAIAGFLVGLIFGAPRWDDEDE